jgi:tetratricopeptide (TPR) repeat protein
VTIPPVSLVTILKEAVGHHQNGDLFKAEKLYKKVLQKDPAQPDALNLLGVIYDQKGDLKNSLKWFDKAINAAPKLASIYFNKGNVLKKMNHPKQAQIAYEAAIQYEPSFQDAFLNLGVLLQEQEQITKALEYFHKLIKMAPRNAKAHYNLGKCYQISNKFEDAKKALSQSLKLNAKDADSHFAIANVYSSQHSYTKAIQHVKKALAIKPNWTEAYTNWGNYLSAVEDFRRAIIKYDISLQISPNNINATVNRSLALLTTGDFKNGWKGYKLRQDSASPFYIRGKTTWGKWSGESIAKKGILIRNEQGIGEEVLYASLLKEISCIADSVTLLCSQKILSVFQRSFKEIKNLTIVEKSNEYLLTDSKFDYELSFGDLGQIFRNSLKSFGNPLTYIRASRKKSTIYRAKLESLYGANKIFIGISWRSGNPVIGNEKSIPLEQWSRILRLEEAQFVNLQYGSTEDELAQLPGNLHRKIISLPSLDLNHDLDDVLSLITAVDLVVTCSNTNAHLAGASGKTTFVLLPKGPARIWYWLLNIRTSIWYKETRLFRQTKAGNWKQPINEVLTQIKLLLLAGSNSP